MCYDYSGPWTPTAQHHAQLFSPTDAHAPSGHAAVSFCLAHGIPPSKLLLGIPCYGRSFLGASAPGDAYSGHAGDEGTFEYRDLPRPGSQAFLDDKSVAAYALGGDGGFVSYDMPCTVKMKARYVKERGLAGLFYWTGTGDRVDGGEEGSLVMAGYCELHR